jgi:hypothetical protein
VSVHPNLITLELRDPAALDAEQLTARLADSFASIGGLATESDRAVARELVRRARLLEKAQRR